MVAQDMFAARPDLMTIQDAHEETGITVQYLRQLAREGRIPAVRIGKRRWYLPKRAFIEWLEGGANDVG